MNNSVQLFLFEALLAAISFFLLRVALDGAHSEGEMLAGDVETGRNRWFGMICCGAVSFVLTPAADCLVHRYAQTASTLRFLILAAYPMLLSGAIALVSVSVDRERQAQRYLRGFLDRSDVAFAFSDTLFRLNYANQAYRQMFGGPDQGQPSGNVFDFAADREIRYEAMRRLYQDRSWTGKMMLEWAGSAALPVWVSARLAIGGDNQLEGVHWTVVPLSSAQGAL